MNEFPSPKKVHSPFQWLQFRVAEANWRWRVWKQLFTGDPARQEEATEWCKIMNSTAPTLFATIKELCFEDVVMSIAKLADPAESSAKGGPRRNLSLKAIVNDEVAKIGEAKLENTMRLVKDFVGASRPLIVWRNWKIAHHDYLVATGDEPLPPLSVTDIEQALTSAVEIMTLLDPTSGTAEYRYREMITRDDGDTLKRVFRWAMQHRRECYVRGERPVE